MKRQEVLSLTESFLKTYGLSKEKTILENAYIFTRPTGFGTKDEWLIYFHQKGEEFYIESNLERLSEKYTWIPSGENGRRFFLSDMPIGVPPAALKKFGFIYQVPVYFFDREFSEKPKSALKELEKDTERLARERIEQPYTYNKGLNEEAEEKDLLDTIVEEIIDPEDACLNIIVAPAGYGKTVLMASLYNKLKEEFISRKKKQEIASRPLLMLPGHIKGANNLDDLINNFVGEEYDFGIAYKDTFDFWVKNNLAIWLLDGLEEFIVKVPEEFIYGILENYITAHDTKKPQIVISIREPLLASSPELRESIEEWLGYGIKFYKLCSWKDQQKKKYFEKNLYIPNPEKDVFIKDLLKSNKISDICNVPYFCSLIANLKNNNQMADLQDDIDLVEYSFKKICEREFEPTKGVDKEIFSVEKQTDLLKYLAELKYIEKNELNLYEVQTYAELFLENVEDMLKNDQIARIKRHALLTSLGENKYDIADDVIKEYLIVLNLCDYLYSVNLSKFNNLNELEYGSFSLRYLAKHSNKVDWEKIFEKIDQFPSERNDAAIAYRNILKIFLSSDYEKKEKLIKQRLHNKNLNGLKLSKLNLDDTDFSCSNLKSVVFESCSLRNANFDNCNFEDTSFDSETKLQGATTRGAYFKSLSGDGKKFFDKEQISAYFYRKTQIRPEIKEPCQALTNLIKVLERIAKKGKGYWIPTVFLERIRCGGGVSADKCVNVLIKERVLSQDQGKIRIKVDLYSDLKDFVNGKYHVKSTDSIKKILDEICPETKLGCKHFPN